MSEILRFPGVIAGLCTLAAAFPTQSRGKERAPGRLVVRYNKSAQGRRLAQSLRVSGTHVTAWEWRRRQLVAFAAMGAVALVLGMGLPGWGLAFTAIRLGFGVRKKLARRAYRASFRPATIAICSALGAELSMQVGLAEAIRRTLQSRPRDRGLAFDILSRAAVLIRAGAQPEPALRASVIWWAGEVEGPLASLLALLEGGGGSVRAQSLARLALGLDADERNAGEVAGALTEARFVAFSIPALAALFAIGLVLANPASAAVLNSMFGVGVCAICAGVACGGVVAVKRLTTQ